MCINFNIINDSIPEETEEISLTLEAVNAMDVEIEESRSMHDVTIEDDDGRLGGFVHFRLRTLHTHSTRHEYKVFFNIISIFPATCIGFVNTVITVNEVDREILACVVLQKPDILTISSSYVLSTQDGTAIGKHYGHHQHIHNIKTKVVAY